MFLEDVLIENVTLAKRVHRQKCSNCNEIYENFYNEKENIKEILKNTELIFNCHICKKEFCQNCSEGYPISLLLENEDIHVGSEFDYFYYEFDNYKIREKFYKSFGDKHICEKCYDKVSNKFNTKNKEIFKRLKEINSELKNEFKRLDKEISSLLSIQNFNKFLKEI